MGKIFFEAKTLVLIAIRNAIRNVLFWIFKVFCSLNI